MPAFTLTPSGPFDLAAAAGFGFGPRTGTETHGEPRMALAFCLDSLEGHAGVELSQDRDGAVHARVEGDGDRTAVKRQVARVLSLDGDGHAFAAIGERDPVLGRLQARYPGLRPVLFHSPYEAAAWSIISARRPAAQAAVVRQALSERLGRVLSAGAAFPTPERLLEVEPLPGLPAVKAERLHALAREALAGDLDQPALIAMDPAEAAEHLQRLPGIGPFYAMLILVRGTGHHDLPPADEPRTLAAIRHFYGPDADAAPVTDGWRPYRTWASVLLHYAGRRAGVEPP
ncbi:MAG: DNA-3-methyladenine glycosylase family protein [Solirubrobacteraceae bacterium]